MNKTKYTVGAVQIETNLPRHRCLCGILYSLFDFENKSHGHEVQHTHWHHSMAYIKAFQSNCTPFLLALTISKILTLKKFDL